MKGCEGCEGWIVRNDVKVTYGFVFFLACSTLSKAGKFETCHSFLFFYLRREARNIPRRHPETYLRNKPLRQTCWFSNIKKKTYPYMNILPTWMACPIFSLNASPSSVHAQKLARRLFAVKLLTRYGVWRLRFTHQSWIIELSWHIMYTTIALRDYLLLHCITIYWYWCNDPINHVDIFS